MSFDFGNNNINPFKAQATYKDGGGMGGGGMYFQQKRKKKEESEDDMFTRSEDTVENEIVFDSEIDDKDIPKDTLVNKFVNWFRLKKD